MVVESTATAASSGTGTLTITKPTGLQVGELLVAALSQFSLSNQAGGWTTPAGWTAGGAVATSNDASHTILYKIADSGDTAASNFSFVAGSATNLVGILIRASGNNPHDGLGNIDTYTSAPTSTAFTGTLDSYTPPVDGALVIMQVGAYSSTGGVSTSTSGYAITTSGITLTEGYDERAFSSDKVVVASAYGIQTTAAALTDYDATFSTSIANHVGQISVFIPPVPATGTNTPVTTTSTAFTQSGTCDTNGSNVLAEATAESLPQTGLATSPTQWNNEAKPSTTWVNESK